MHLGIMPGDLIISMDELGQVEPTVVLSTTYNVIPIWLKIAKDRLSDAKHASEKIALSWNDDTNNRQTLLMAELAPSMEVIVSCGIALDSLYDMLRPHAKLSEEDINKWKKRRTSRGTQIFEVVRRVLKLENEYVKNFKEAITQIIKLRDMAVHPSLAFKNALFRPDLGVAVDWKFGTYEFANASACFKTTMQIFMFIHQREKLNQELVVAFRSIFESLEELGVVKRVSE